MEPYLTFTIPQSVADDLVCYLDDEDVFSDVVEALLAGLPAPAPEPAVTLDSVSGCVKAVTYDAMKHPKHARRFNIPWREWTTAAGGPIEDTAHFSDSNTWWLLSIDKGATFATKDFWVDWVLNAPQYLEERKNICGWYNLKTDMYVTSPMHMP